MIAKRYGLSLLVGIAFLMGASAQVLYDIKSIDNVLDLNVAGDSVKYVLQLYNDYNFSIDVSFYSTSPDWYLQFIPSSIEISPKSSENVTIIGKPMRDKITTSIQVTLLIYGNNTKISKQVFLHPVILQKETTAQNETSIKPKICILYSNNTVSQGEEIYFTVKINNPYPEKKTFNIVIKSDLLPYPKRYTLVISPNNNGTASIPLKVSKMQLPGEYNVSIYVKMDDKLIYNVSKSIEVVSKNTYNVGEEISGNTIILYNNEDVAIPYTFEKKVTWIDKVFKKYEPSPSYIIKSGNEEYYVWDLILLPHERYSIRETTNWTNISIIVLFIVIAVLYAYYYLALPRVVIRKEIAKIDKKNGKIKFMITVKNVGHHKIKGVKVRDYNLPMFKIIDEDYIIKPINWFVKNNKLIIDWYIDELEPKEERILTYTVKYDTEIIGDIVLDPAVVEFRFMNKKLRFKSNKLLLRFV